MNSLLIFFYVYAFIVGCCVMSFINVIIYRLPLGISVARGRSFCPCCHHQLKASDLFPILSYLYLRGRCRYCHQVIPIKDTLYELLGGLFAMFCFWFYGFHYLTIIAFGFGMVCFAISQIDFQTMEIPNSLIIACLVITLISFPFIDISFVERMIGFLILSLPLYVLNYVIPNCIGGGDIKLLAVCGLMLGWKYVLIGMFIAVMLAGIYAGYLMIVRKVSQKDYIAFGPYICLGMFMTLLYGQNILEWYLSFFVW